MRKRNTIKIFILFAILLSIVFFGSDSLAADTASTKGGTTQFFGAVDNICDFWKKIFDFAMQIAGALSLMVVAIGGVYYLTSFGKTDRQQTAKSIMSGAFFGLLLALVSWTLFNVLNPYILQCKIDVPELDLYKDPYDGDACDGSTKYDTAEECTDAEERCSGEGGYRTTPCIPNTKKTKPGEKAEEQEKKFCCPGEDRCGKNLVHISETWRGQCFGACHCATWVSNMLIESGCPRSIGTTSANTVFAKLRAMGWECEAGPAGTLKIQAGDIVHKPSHIEIAISSTQTVGSNTGTWYKEPEGQYYMSACSSYAQCTPDQPKLMKESYGACVDCVPPKEAVWTNQDESPTSGRFCLKCDGSGICQNNQCVSIRSGVGRIFEYCRLKGN